VLADDRSMTTTDQTSLDRFLTAAAGPRQPKTGARARAPRTAHERLALLDDLEHPLRWPAAAACLLAELGYRLVEPGPATGDDSHLLVALREEPTRRHFDPESIAYYAPSGRVAALATLDRARATMRDGRATQALWGHVHVIDRIPVENRFLTFGGELRMAQADAGLTVVDLWSPAPIVRWGGHSQPTDPLAQAIGAFFGRLMVPIDFVAGAAEKVDALLPEVLYRAFLIDVLAREAQGFRHGAPSTALHAWLLAAWRRAAVDQTACAAATSLLVELGIGSPHA
jgi:hypothetical protein